MLIWVLQSLYKYTRRQKTRIDTHTHTHTHTHTLGTQFVTDLSAKQSSILSHLYQYSEVLT
jgi:hypothetical protein